MTPVCAPDFKLQTNGVVVFLGGANAVAAQETLLTVIR